MCVYVCGGCYTMKVLCFFRSLAAERLALTVLLLSLYSPLYRVRTKLTFFKYFYPLFIKCWGERKKSPGRLMVPWLIISGNKTLKVEFYPSNHLVFSSTIAWPTFLILFLFNAKN